MVVLGVRVVLQVCHVQGATLLELEVLLLIIPHCGRAIHSKCRVYSVLQVFSSLAYHQALGVGAIVLRVQPELPKAPVRLAATASPAVDHDVGRTGDVGQLRP